MFAVLNCKKNQLHVIDFDEINKLFVDLITNYDFVLANSAIFYIYDRDVYSYTGSQRNAPREYIQLLTNARDDGLLLLSYPCIEAFVTSNFDDNAHQRSHEKGSDDLKPFNKSNQYYQQNIDLSSLAKSVLQMDKALELLGINDYDFSDFARTNLKIYDAQEKIYGVDKKFRLLSLFCIALMELGIIEEETDIDPSEPRRK